jgi:hypothetical protein
MPLAMRSRRVLKMHCPTNKHQRTILFGLPDRRIFKTKEADTAHKKAEHLESFEANQIFLTNIDFNFIAPTPSILQ